MNNLTETLKNNTLDTIGLLKKLTLSQRFLFNIMSYYED